MLDLVWLIPALPLAGFVVLALGGRRLGEPLAGWLATALMFGSFGVSLIVFAGLAERDAESRFFVQTLFTWVPAGDFSVDVGFLVDPLSVTMTLFITGVGALIHLYSIGYMHGDPNYSKFFVYMNLFAFSMLVLVLGDNLLLTFLGWEGVGLCSYFLISFWFTDEANASAGKKAFVTNRVGDWGFMVAMFLAFATVGSITYADLLSGAGEMATSTATAITLLLFVGAAGKSAQFPLYLWLPDAMAGPTPVSALIHAATMVTSGVYLLVRVNPIIAEASSWAPSAIAWIGLFTALFAASIAIAQNDIKRVLAYSTVSQLGFMVVAVGVGGYVPAIFHMVTHAFFKALLFLGAGSVIHGMDNDQDMRRYGGLARLMPITAITMIVGWLAIAGVPPLAGFWSKDEILVFAYAENKVMWALLLLAAVMTAFYMSRLVFLTFFGERRWTDQPSGSEVTVAPARHPHESPWTMAVPLVALAGLSLVGGLINLPFAKDLHVLETWLEPSLFGNEAHLPFGGGTKWVLAIVAIVSAAVGVAGAVTVYLRRRVPAERVEPDILAEGWRYDRTVTDLVGGPGRRGFELVSWFDRTVVDGAVNGVGAIVRRGGGVLRLLQNGLVRSYAAGVAAGAVVLMAYFLARTSF